MIGRRALWLGCGFTVAACCGFFIIGCDESGLTGVTAAAKVVLPESVALDISEFPDDETDPDFDPPQNRQFPRPFMRPCKAAGAILHGFQLVHNRGLRLAAQINDDLIDPDSPFVEGTLDIAGREIPYKADFSAFDIDGDGVPDGSGRWDTEPVALRMWIIGPEGGARRVLAALISTRPLESSIGAGQMYHAPALLHPMAHRGFRSYVVWDHTNMDDRWHEAYTTGRHRRNMSVRRGHHLVEVVALEDESVQKTVRSTAIIDESDFRFSEFRYAGRTIRGSGVALVSTEAIGEPDVVAHNRCISLEDCDDAEVGACDGIDPTGMEFLAAPVGGETDWPLDFPEEPTF